MPSTFLQAYVPPVYMPEDNVADTVSSVNSSVDSESEEGSDSDLDLPHSVKETAEYKELMALKSLRQVKLGGSAEHYGYKVSNIVSIDMKSHISNYLHFSV